jgi:aminotransferase
MLTRQELEGVARVAERHDLLVITDEVYEYIRYDGREHLSPATFDGLTERTVTLTSLSKTFSITGWRLGFVYAPEPMAKLITLANDLYYVCAARPLMHGVIAGLRAPDSFFADLRQRFQRKRDMLCDTLAEVGLNPIRPQGAYYVLADISHLGYGSALEAAMALLQRGKVAAVPGTAFYRGETGERLLRFCFALEDSVLEQACENLQQFQLAHT